MIKRLIVLSFLILAISLSACKIGSDIESLDTERPKQESSKPNYLEDQVLEENILNSESFFFDLNEYNSEEFEVNLIQEPLNGTLYINDEYLSYVAASGYEGSDYFIIRVFEYLSYDEINIQNIIVRLSIDRESIEADLDTDGDGIVDLIDNCPEIANPDQNNNDDDALGNACDPDAIPEISLLGASSLQLLIYQEYHESGAIAFDADGNDLSDLVIITGTVNVDLPGEYMLTYDVLDEYGREAASLTRTVTVILDTNAPVITLLGNDPETIPQGDTYIDSGAEAFDLREGDVTDRIVVGGDFVDTNTPGTYVLTYNVVDSDGYTARELTRTVMVGP